MYLLYSYVSIFFYMYKYVLKIYFICIYLILLIIKNLKNNIFICVFNKITVIYIIFIENINKYIIFSIFYY